MELKKITEADLQGVGVIGMEDTPNLSALEMQKKVEEVVREVVIPAINTNVDRTASKEDLRLAVFKAGAGDMQAQGYDNDLDGVVNRADNGFFTYTHTKSGTTHYLTGSGDNVKFVATADYSEGDTFMIDGSYYPAFLINGENLPDGFFKADMALSCFRHGNCLNFNNGGSGNILNFKVVGGTTRPVSPSENTIWVKTSTPVIRYSVRGIATPTYTADEGYVHIVAEMSGSNNATMNILKKNSIYIKFGEIYQYENGGWNRKEAYIWQSDNWVQLSAMVVTIYPGATVTTLFTGYTGVVSGFKISRTGYQEGYGIAYITVDLTSVSQVTVAGSIGDCCGVCLSKTLPQANINPGALSVASQNSDTGYKHDSIWYKNNWDTQTTISINETFDVSAYSGVYYLVLALYGSDVTRAATMTEITLVKTV